MGKWGEESGNEEREWETGGERELERVWT